ncbi:MAG: SDR family oxidoreductase [Candidatus Bathyarchaeota archaeon]|nr:SDR family oxidoreductase [Candidatus Bathyarchaeota archaeon]
MNLSGKVVVITGAGRGIGKATALMCAREGADLVVASRTQSEFMDTAKQAMVFGRRVIPLHVDVSDKNDVALMVKTAVQKLGRIDVLVNAAGIIGSIGPFIDNETDEWINAINVNLIGTFLCCKNVLPHMIKQGGGKIINFSGGGATFPRPRFSAYATSKSAVVGLTATLAEEMKEYNIQINALAPGAVFSRIHEQVLLAGLKAGDKELMVSKRTKENKDEPSPTEVTAECVVFLASDASCGLTGRLISAVWDDWQQMTGARLTAIMASDLYTLRRIDNVFFAQVAGK